MCESNAYFIKDGKEETDNGKCESCKAARPKDDAEEHFWGRACGGGKSAGNGSQRTPNSSRKRDDFVMLTTEILRLVFCQFR